MNRTKFRRKLKRFDRYLDIEPFPDGSIAIIDKSRIIGHRKIDLGGAARYHTVYDRVLHVDKHRELGGGVINELNFRRMSRWGRKKDFKLHLQNQLDKDEYSKNSAERDFQAEIHSQMGKIKNFSVDMGKNLCPSH